MSPNQNPGSLKHVYHIQPEVLRCSLPTVFYFRAHLPCVWLKFQSASRWNSIPHISYCVWVTQKAKVDTVTLDFILVLSLPFLLGEPFPCPYSGPEGSLTHSFSCSSLSWSTRPSFSLSSSDCSDLPLVPTSTKLPLTSLSLSPNLLSHGSTNHIP